MAAFVRVWMLNIPHRLLCMNTISVDGWLWEAVGQKAWLVQVSHLGIDPWYLYLKPCFWADLYISLAASMGILAWWTVHSKLWAKKKKTLSSFKMIPLSIWSHAGKVTNIPLQQATNIMLCCEMLHVQLWYWLTCSRCSTQMNHASGTW